MAYCTTADVQVYLSENITIDATSDPALTDVDQMCVDVSENIIDSLLNRYVTIPVADVQGLKFLKQWAITCVLLKIYRAIESEPEVQDRYSTECDTYKEMFLSDPGMVSTPIKHSTGGRAKGSTRPDIKWKRGEEQW